MTGVNNVNHNIGAGDVGNQIPVNVPAGGNNAGGVGNAGHQDAEALRMGFDVFMRNGEIQRSEHSVASLTMSRKFAAIESQVDRAVSGHANMTLGDLTRLLLDHSETVKTESGQYKTLFRDAREAVALDNFMLDMVKKLVGACCFGGQPNQVSPLKTEIEEALARIIKGDYRTAERNEVIAGLAATVDRVKALVNSENGPRKNEALSLLDDIRNRFSAMVENRYTASLSLSKALKSHVPVSFNSPENILGMGCLLKKCQTDLEKVVTLPRIDVGELARKVTSGELGVREAISNNPLSSFFMKDFSAANLEKYRKELQDLDLGSNEIEARKSGLRHRITRDWTRNSEIKKDIRNFTADILERIKELNLIKEDAEGFLTETDSEKLYAGAGHSYEERISAEVARLKHVYDAMGGERGAALERLAGDTELFAHVLKTFDYAPKLLVKFLENSEAVDALLALRGENPSDDTVRQSINSLAQFIHSPNSDFDSTMLSSLLAGISQEDLPESARVIMQNLPIRYELTKDALSCINYVVNGNDQNRSPLNISMRDLGKAYRRVCNPGPGLMKTLKDNHCEQDLKTVENIIIRAAYHQFLSDHPSAQDETNGFRLPFKENVRFQAAMNISDTDTDGKIDIARYDGFDPTTVNIRNTEMTTFLKCFNIMMSHSDFIESCGKIPAVHLTERFTETLGPRMKEFFKGIIDFYNTKKAEARGDEAVLRELRTAIDPQEFNAFYASFRRCNTSRELMTFFENNTRKFTELFIASNKLTLDGIRNHNETALRENQTLINNLHLDELVKFSRTSSSKVGAEIKNVTGTEELLQEVAKMRGSAGLGFLAASVEHLCARTVIDIIPAGHTCFGLAAEDFRDTRKLNNIAAALRNVPENLRATSDFKLAFLTYAKLTKLASENPGAGIVSEQALINVRLNRRFVSDLVNIVQSVPQARVNGGDPLLASFEVIDRNSLSGDALVDFCLNDAKFTDRDRKEALNKLTLTADMFAPENNIFVSNKAEGEKLRARIQNAIDGARAALKAGNADVHAVLRRLQGEISKCLARDGTHNITSALVYLSPYFEQEFGGAEIQNHEAFITRKFNAMFSSGNTVSKLRNSLVSTSAEVAGDISGMMNSFRAGSRSSDAAVSELMKNEFVSLLAEKALRRVAYGNNFRTYADFKFEFSKNPDIAGKGRDAVIREAVSYLKTELAVDDVVLEKMIRQLTSSDLYSNDTTSKSKYAKRAVRSFGRALRSTKVISSIASGFKTVKSWFTGSSGDAKVYEAISGKVLTSLEEGQTLIHTKDNKVSVEAGKNFKVGNLQVGASAGITLGAGSNLEVERSSDREYTFRMSASLGASLGIGGNLGTITDPTLAAKLEFGGNYQRGYSVTLGEDDAVQFLSKIMASDLKQTDFQKSREIRRETVKNFDFDASLEGGIKGTAQMLQGEDDSSMYDPLQFSASAEFGYSKEWSHEVATSSHRFSKNVSITASLGVEASFSLKNQLLGGANPDKMGEEEGEEGEDDVRDVRNLGEKSRDEIDPELLKYNDDSKKIGSVDKIVHLFTNHKKALNDQFFSSMIVDRFSARKYLPVDKNNWRWMDDVEKYQHDPGRFVAESAVNFAKTNVTDNAVSDFDGFLEYLGRKIPGVSQALEFKEKISELVTSLEGLVNRLDTPNFRFDLGFKLGDDSNELLTVNAGVSYRCDTTTSYETNLFQNELRSVEQTTKIEPEEKGSDSTKKMNNIRFLSKTMKKLGFTGRQTEKAIARLNAIQNGNEELESIEIVRTGKKSSLAKISKKLHREGGSFAEKLGSRVDSMKDEDFTPLKIVFNTVKKIDSTSAGISAGGVIRVSLSSEETLNSNKSYEVEF